jgi:hypothetical protein
VDEHNQRLMLLHQKKRKLEEELRKINNEIARLESTPVLSQKRD